MRTFGFVFARGGSKGVPGKNIRDLAGKPLLAHALHVASQVTEIERVFVSTDSSDIAAVAERFGATSILRPAELAQDDSPEWLAWRHAINWVKTKWVTLNASLVCPRQRRCAPLKISPNA